MIDSIANIPYTFLPFDGGKMVYKAPIVLAIGITAGALANQMVGIGIDIVIAITMIALGSVFMIVSAIIALGAASINS